MGASQSSGKRSKHLVAILFLILAVIAAGLGVLGHDPAIITPARIFAFVFGLLFVLFLAIGLVGRVKN